MPPPNWGRSNPGPRAYSFLSAGRAVRDRYTVLGGEAQLGHIFEAARLNGAELVFIDSPYIDLDYRSDLAHFYARAFRPPPATTERLLFARGHEIIGACVMRPLPQPVGRTMLAPPPEAEPYVSCLATMTVNAFGHAWPVGGFPFMSQDGEYGVCAHAAIWAIARYHHLRFGTDRHTISGIIEAAGLRERTDRTARSEGLYALEILRAFRGLGLPALNYDIAAIPAPESAPKVICRYLNSGIPVGVLTGEHMMVLCGYGERTDGTIFYFVSDDNSHAYGRVDEIPEGEANSQAWKMLVIPMPGRIHVSGEGAEARAEEVFEDRLRADRGPQHLLKPWCEGKLRVRTHAVQASEYVARLADRNVAATIREHHVYAPKGSWLWVSEFQDLSRAEDDQVVGEIAIDATSQQLDPSPLFGNIDGWAYVWTSHREDPRVVQAEPGGSAHGSALPDRRERSVRVQAREWVPVAVPPDVS